MRNVVPAGRGYRAFGRRLGQQTLERIAAGNGFWARCENPPHIRRGLTGPLEARPRVRTQDDHARAAVIQVMLISSRLRQRRNRHRHRAESHRGQKDGNQLRAVWQNDKAALFALEAAVRQHIGCPAGQVQQP